MCTGYNKGEGGDQQEREEGLHIQAMARVGFGPSTRKGVPAFFGRWVRSEGRPRRLLGEGETTKVVGGGFGRLGFVANDAMLALGFVHHGVNRFL